MQGVPKHLCCKLCVKYYIIHNHLINIIKITELWHSRNTRSQFPKNEVIFTRFSRKFVYYNTVIHVNLPVQIKKLAVLDM